MGIPARPRPPHSTPPPGELSDACERWRGAATSTGRSS
jgi:hypothetical protein